MDFTGNDQWGDALNEDSLNDDERWNDNRVSSHYHDDRTSSHYHLSNDMDASNECQDVKDVEKCTKYAKKDYCSKYEKWMKKNCCQTCSHLDLEECRDEAGATECMNYRSNGICDRSDYHNYMKENCAKTCGICVNGGYSNWTNFSECTKTCGGGQKYRKRLCDKPKPQNSGKNCSSLGKPMESQTCNTDACPVTPICKDTRKKYCELRATKDTCKEGNRKYKIMKKYCQKTCKFCSSHVTPICRDALKKYCELRATKDTCKEGNKKYKIMKKYCQKTCKFCSSHGSGGSGSGSGSGSTIKAFPQAGCGLDVTSSQIFKRIVGGQEAEKHKWKWQGALYHKGKYICGGTLLNNNMFLTAAHCVIGKKSSDCEVKMGMHDRSHESAPNLQSRKVDNLVYHEEYYKGRDVVANDIALLKVESPFTLNDYVGIACLPKQNDILPDDKQSCYVTGWGKTGGGGRYSNILMQAQMPIVPSTSCSDHKKLTDKQFCAGNKATDISTCLGDSGGPIVCKKNNKWFIEGVVSFGSDECKISHLLSVFTRVSQYITWIEQAYSKLVKTQ